MHDNDVQLVEIPEHDVVTVCVYVEHDGVYELGERLNAKFAEAYMNGYNWDAVISSYVASADPELMAEVRTDPEAGLFSAHMTYGPESIEKMKRFESLVREMLADEDALMTYIAEHRGDIEWD